MLKNIIYLHCGGDTIGGIETFMHYHLNYHNKYNPIIFFVRDGNFPQFLLNKGFRSAYFLGGGKLRELHKLLKAIYNSIKLVKVLNPEIIIGQGIYSWIYAGIISKLCNVKSIFYVHGNLKKENFTFIDNISLLFKPTAYVANSKFTANSIKKFFPNAKIYINYPGANKVIFDQLNTEECKSELIKEFNFPSDAKIIINVGRIQEWKGQDIAIKAFIEISKSFKNVFLIILGEPTFKSDQEFLNKLKAMVEYNHLQDKVIFAGQRMDIAKFFKGSDIILHSTKEESFGLVIIEGMLARKPVIATRSGGPEEIIDHNINGFLVKPNDTEEIVHYIKAIFEDSEFSLKISENAYSKASNLFTSEKSTKRLEEIIDQQINN